VNKEKLAVCDALIAKCNGIERKGKTVPHTAANGYMFTLFNKEDEIGIRFSKETQKKYLDKFNTTLFHSHGAVMKGYILIPESMWKDLDLLSKLVNESHDYVQSLHYK